jgi:hypothetical protein
MSQKTTDPPIELLEQLLSATPFGEKVKVPNKRSELVAMRERLFMMGRGNGRDFAYIDSLLDYERQGRIEFLPEDS